jgi:hypothetical protein
MAITSYVIAIILIATSTFLFQSPSLFISCHYNPIISTIISSSEIKRAYYFISDKTPHLNIHLGTPSQSIPVEIDLQSETSLINPLYFDPYRSSSIHNHGNQRISLQNSITYLNMYKDKLTLCPDEQCLNNKNTIQLNDFTFYMEDYDAYEDIANVIGLGYPTKDNAFINTIINSNTINENTFTIIPHTNKTGYILFGNYTNINAILNDDNLYNKMTCPLITQINITKWACSLKSITIQPKIGTYRFYNIKPVYFQANTEDIYIPKSFAEFLENTILKNTELKSHCKVGDYYQMKKISCDPSVTDIINITFTFGNEDNNDLQLKQIITHDSFDSFLVFKYLYQNEDAWILGTSFLFQYVSVFNIDHKTISLYESKYNFTYVHEHSSKHNIIIKLNIILIIIMIIFILLLLYLKIYHE